MTRPEGIQALLRERFRATQERRDSNTPEPPEAVMDRARNGTLTVADVKKYPAYFISTTQGRALAGDYRCEHGYGYLDSCSNCE